MYEDPCSWQVQEAYGAVEQKTWSAENTTTLKVVFQWQLAVILNGQVCCFTLKKVWPQSRSKEIVSLRHLVRWRKKRYWHEDGFRCCQLKEDLCGEFSFEFALDGHRLSPLRFRQSVMVFHIPGQLLIDTQCSEPTPQCETVNWSLGPCLQMNSDQPPVLVWINWWGGMTDENSNHLQPNKYNQ